jgi:hypothetical protein
VPQHDDDRMTVTLLGPQRVPTVDRVVRRLDIDGPIATVTAGWREREAEDAELDTLLGSRSINLALYRRWMDLQERDPEFGGAQRSLRESLDEAGALYVLRLEHALHAVEALQRTAHWSGRCADEIVDAIAAVRALDERHLRLVSDIYAEFFGTWRPLERPVLAGHRQHIAEVVHAAAAVVIAGGHVGVLSLVLQLFDIATNLECPIIAWSAGAMALTDRIVLFHDRTPQGAASPEILARGLSLVSGIVAVPHARARLLTEDFDRMAVFARRFAPARCMLLDQGTTAVMNGSGIVPPGVRFLADDGRIRTSVPE